MTNTTCTNHRVILISSEQIYTNKHHFGEPVEEKVVYKCFCCNLVKEYTFKIEKTKS